MADCLCEKVGRGRRESQLGDVETLNQVQGVSQAGELTSAKVSSEIKREPCRGQEARTLDSVRGAVACC
jgi:hypothetical protein